MDIQKLKEEADYWDDVAPEGATHFGVRSKIFYKKESGRRWYSWYPNIGLWVSCGTSWPAMVYGKPEKYQ